ncbi:MAG: HAMP domain-containing histidine kinase [Acidobacteria bacterium]|nr:HAMP domain-containing histidine kinase [Acidobacteriota bacterium]
MNRAPHRWWYVFGLATALPAIILGLLALRAVRLVRMEAQAKAQEEHRQSAATVDAVIAATVAELERDDDAALITYQFDSGGLLIFPRDRVYFGEFGARPKQLTKPLSESALNLIEQARSDRNPALYRAVARVEPALGSWVRWSIAQLEHSRAEDFSTAEGTTPSGLPVALLAAFDDPGTAAQSLRKLRAGTWWLSYDERSFHDAELRHVLMGGQGEPDTRLTQLASLERSLRRAASRLTAGPGRFFEVDGANAWLVLPSSADQAQGKAIPLSTLRGSLTARLPPAIPASAEYADLRDSTSGIVLWSGSAGKGAPHDVVSLASVPGWKWGFRGGSVERTLQTQQLLWYGFIGFVLVMFASGLTMTAQVIRREMDLIRRQTDFTAAVTHEFKSPITSIRLLVELLTRRPPASPEAAAELYESIDRETARLDTLVSRVLDSQKAGHNERLHYSCCSLNTLAQGAITRFAAQAEARHIELRMEEPGLNLTVHADSSLLGEALDNLIDNAIRYSPERTCVSIAVRNAGGKAIVEVRDQGIGIDEADLPHIFDRFYRGSRGDRYNVRGTGLGLSIVKSAVEAHLGTVEVESTPAGSTFRIGLPPGTGKRER